jgi:hypothetical protein
MKYVNIEFPFAVELMNLKGWVGRIKFQILKLFYYFLLDIFREFFVGFLEFCGKD